MNQDKKLASLAIILLEENDQTKILMLKRSDTDKSFPGTWCLPGGRVDEGESFEEACVREVKEETNLDVINKPSLFGVYEGEFDFKIQAFIVEVKGKVSLSHEHSEFELFDLYNYDQSVLSGKVTNKIFKDLRG